MDGRRGRVVIDPKVRQVGFVTPGCEVQRPAAGEGSAAGHGRMAVANSPSPVIIQGSMPSMPGKWPQLPESYNPSDASPPLSSSLSMSMSSRPDVNGFAGPPLETTECKSPTEVIPSSGSGADGSVLDDFTDKLFIGKGEGVDGNREGALSIVAEPVAGTVARLAKAKLAAADSRALKERTSKAERRALQNAQRAEKAIRAESGGAKPGALLAAKEGNAAKAATPKETGGDRKSVGGAGDKKAADKSSEKKLPSRMQFDDPQRVAKAKKRAFTEQTESKNRLELFRHLPQFDHGDKLPLLEAKYFLDDVTHPHPAVYKIGLQFLTGDVMGGNARCTALLSAFREVIQDYATPPEKVLARDLTARINSQVSFLIECRPLSISMGNGIKFLKTRIGKLSVTLQESEAKASLIAEIDRFLREKILFADQEIVRHAVTKITDGDVLLTYGYSSVVEMILVRANEMGKRFRVVVVDSRPKLEGRLLLRKLVEKGLRCTYCHLNAVTYIMQEVTRVFLGAASVLSNGFVFSRVGTACVAMVAHSCNIPVMICCETYKFHERVQLDSICSNELGDPEVLVKVPGRKDVKQLEGWKDPEHLQLLNLTYDATPAAYVAMVITELGMVPPTSVPAILREFRKESPI